MKYLASHRESFWRRFQLPLRFPSIPFAAIYGMRNQLSHGYFTVEWETVWTTIERDIPELAAELQKAIEQLSKACD